MEESYTVTEVAPGANVTMVPNTFTSNNITSGVAYDFQVDDGSGTCPAVTVSGIRDCNCLTEAGTMNLNTIEACGMTSVTASYDNTNETSDGNDVLEFVLHEGAGGTLTNIVQTNATPTFSFTAAMTYGTTYYISAIFGNDLEEVQLIKLTHVCL